MKEFETLQDGKAIIVNFDRFDAMATGVAQARQNNLGDVRLIYTDYTEEIGRIDYDINGESPCLVVGDVQAAARVTHRKEEAG